MKLAYFLPFSSQWVVARLAHVFVQEVVRLHGVPASVILDRDPRFSSKFWNNFQEALSMEVLISSAYHPQTDGQSEQTIQMLEDLLRACCLD